MNETTKESKAGEADVSAREHVATAEKAAADARYKAEKQAERAAKAERKAKRAGRDIVPKKVKLAIGAGLVIIAVVALVVGVPAIQAKMNKTNYFTASSLTKIVNVSKLSTAEYRYNGIADKCNDKGEAEYHVYYESTISASYDMSAISFDIDEEAKTITPHLPEPEIGDPSIDTTTLDYLPKNPGANLKDVVSICKADALAEVKSAGGVLYTANENMQRTVEALLKPLCDEFGYEVQWSDGGSDYEDAETEQSDGQTVEQEGDSDE